MTGIPGPFDDAVEHSIRAGLPPTTVRVAQIAATH